MLAWGREAIRFMGLKMQLGDSEIIADTVHFLSRFVDIVILRTTKHQRMLE